MDYKDLTISEFISHLSSSEPVPGGGGASALAAALGLALGNMVGNLTLGKKKYANVQEDIIRLNNISQKLQESFLLLIDKDAEAFKPLSKAYGLPKDTCELLEKREKIFEEALVNASAAPIEIMKSCCEALDILDEYAAKGTTIAISDVAVGAVFLKSALLGASLNVFINTGLMKNRAAAEKFNDEADRMIRDHGDVGDRIFSAIFKKFRNPRR